MNKALGHYTEQREIEASQGAEPVAGDMEAFEQWKAYPLPPLNSDGHFTKDYLHREWVAFRAGRKSIAAAPQEQAPYASAIRNAALEEAAHAAENTDVATCGRGHMIQDDGSQTRSDIADAIRALQSQPSIGGEK